MLPIEKKIEAVVRTRRATADTLMSALETLPREGFSEKQLADKWLGNIKENSNILACGWYLPPPNGMSILIGNPPDYSRLRYNSLREVKNWPSAEIKYANHSILYPYFSALDKDSLLLGDFVGTFYQGNDEAIRNWINNAYQLTREIAEFIQPGQRVCDIYNFAQHKFNLLGVSNNTYSQSGGLASDIGHSMPGFNESLDISGVDLTDKNIAALIAGARWFVSKSNDRILEDNFGLTIEPQLIAPKLPMASFHIIVLSANGRKTIVSEFDLLFKYFGMSEWMSR